MTIRFINDWNGFSAGMTRSLSPALEAQAKAERAAVDAVEAAPEPVAVRGDPLTGALIGPDAKPLPAVSGAGIRTLKLELASANSILGQLPDGRLIGTSNDSAGNFGGQLWQATGAFSALNRTTIPNTNTPGLLDYLGVSIGVASIKNAWMLPDGNFLFIAENTAGKAFMYYAYASGGTFTVGNNAGTFDNKRPCFAPGLVGATHVGNVRHTTNRSLCIATIGGSPVLLFGEYAFGSGRVPGQTNDVCRIWRSNDLGKTWSVWITWNQNGATSNVRHVHSIVQDPETGFVYIMIGDDPWSSLIRWDGAGAALPDNTDMANVGNYPGWEVLPTDEYFRSVDLVFSSGVASYLIDNTVDRSRQVVMEVSRRGRLAALRGRPVNTERFRDPTTGLALPGGGAVWFSMWDTTIGAVKGFDVWVSSDNRLFARVGELTEYGSSGSFGVLQNVFWCRNRIIVTQGPGASRLVPGAWGSLIFSADGFFDGTEKVLA